MAHRGLGVSGVLTVSLVVLASSAWTQGSTRSNPTTAVRPLGVGGAAADATTGLLTIRGRRLLPPPEAQPAPVVVRLGERELEVLSATDDAIEVRLPEDIPAGRYPLFVSSGPGAAWAGELDLGAKVGAAEVAPLSELRIREARADLGTLSLSLQGEGFVSAACPTPTVTLADVPLVLVSASETEIEAQLPSGLAPAGYRVRVLRGPEPLPDEGPGTGGSVLLTESFDVAVAAAGAGGDITAVLTPAGGGLQGGADTGDVSLRLLDCAAGQVLKSSGSSWACASDADTGVNAVVNGGGITGSISGGTLTLGSTAASANTASAIVARNGAGSFSAGSIALAGNLDLANTSSASVGVLNKAGGRFLHNYGTDNTFLGAGAGNLALTGAGNTAVGAGSLSANTNGDDNSAFGRQALTATTHGYHNSAFGAGAMQVNVGGDQNAAFGRAALAGNTTGGQNSAFGNVALESNTTGIFNAAFGHRALQANTTGGSNSAFGTHALAANTDASGQSAFGYQALTANTRGSGNAAFGYQALAASTETSGHSAFGYQALAANTTGYRNAAFGHQALADNTSGYMNSAFGGGALRANTEGRLNVAVGHDALQMNTTGNNNAAFGYMGLGGNMTGSYNAAFGTSALIHNQTGLGNAAFGTYGLLVSSTGDYNTAVGTSALDGMTDGSSNIAVGASAGTGLRTGSYNIFIGSPGLAGDTTTIRIGTTSGGSGTVHTATYVAGISGRTSASGVAVYVNADGKLGTLTSSARYKQEIADMSADSDALMKLRPVSFYYRPELDETHTRQYGLVAEEVAQVAPELVVWDESGAPQTVRYHVVNAMLLNEVQKQQQRLEAQDGELRAQGEQLQTQAAELRELKDLLSSLTARDSR